MSKQSAAGVWALGFIAVGVGSLSGVSCSSSEDEASSGSSSGTTAETTALGTAASISAASTSVNSAATASGTTASGTTASGTTAGGTSAASSSGATTGPQTTAVTTAGGTTTGGVSTASSSGAGGTTTTGSDETTGASSTGGDQGQCPSGGIEAGDTERTITVDGLERHFLIHTPPSYDGTTRLPVVFDFHGLGGNGSMQRGFSGWAAAGDEHGFITVFGDGYEEAWNAGLCCGDAADDVAFVRAMLMTLQTEACVDSKRIYASGCSNGGGMSYKLACKAADVMAAVAPVDFDCVDGTACGDCEPSRPISVIQFRGTNDSLVDYEGAGAFVGAENNFAIWGEINMCTGEPTALGSNSACQTYPMCSGDVETVLCTVQNGSHCGSYNSFMIPEVAWGVLQQHTLP